MATKDPATAADYVWDRTGVVGTYSNWESGAPHNQFAGEVCAAMRIAHRTTATAEWYDSLCNKDGSQMFVCKQGNNNRYRPLTANL